MKTINLEEMEEGIRYRIVSKGGGKATLREGDLVWLEPNGDLMNGTAGGWMDATDAKSYAKRYGKKVILTLALDFYNTRINEAKKMIEEYEALISKHS